MENSILMTNGNPYIASSSVRAISRWLLVCALLVAMMVAVGGYTRLSGSGLSITEWKPVHGIIPPMDEAQWQEEFAAYRQSPQFAKVNPGMELPEFRSIYWPEYFHRLLGRAIGIVFFLPLLYFGLRRRLKPRFFARLTLIFALGGAQGLMGWLMVQSGLVYHPYVSHLRLAAHLLLAFVLFGLLLWAWLDVRQAPQEAASPAFLRLFMKGWILLLLVQVTFGAFLAGLHGGLIYNTFPDMNGEFLPTGMWHRQPWWENLYENIATIQFIHRWLAKFLLISYVLLWWKSRKHVKDVFVSRCMSLLMLLLWVQAGLGIATLLAQAPLDLALAHQLTALAVFGSAATVMHGLHRTRNAARMAARISENHAALAHFPAGTTA